MRNRLSMLFLPVRGTRRERSLVEVIDVRDVAHEAALRKLLRHHVAEPFDIHRAARREMPDALVDLRRAGGVGAARHRLARRMVHVGAADRAAFAAS